MSEWFSTALRLLVATRAEGRCEYCLMPEDHTGFPHEVDHVVSRKHGGSSDASNLAYSCMLCNRYKGTDLASLHRSGRLVRFFDPRRDLWRSHFRLQGPVIEPLSETGEVTARLLRLNDTERVVERSLLQSLGRYPR